MSDPRFNWAIFVVLRPAPDLPAGFLPEKLDGQWFNLVDLVYEAYRDPDGPSDTEGVQFGPAGARAYPTGRYETRDDGAEAEVYEVRAL
ncbi:hypothetical protein [Dactylosporangium sp. CS-033363]|uniref:hypothetical protein n=1 Tax=Dactylosporangium sp. CS-033363 TaxID=3239935 RepID=UPI003D8EA6BE